MTIFDRAVQALCDGGVDFVIIGGVSASLHGSAYVTQDLDICYSRARSNLQSLVQALRPFSPRPRGLPPDLPFVWDEVTLNNATVLTLETALGDVDLLAEVAGIGSFAEVKKRSVIMNAFDRSVATLSLKALIQAKRAAGRMKDQLLIPELESLLEIEKE